MHISQETDHDKKQIWKVPTLMFWQHHTNSRFACDLLYTKNKIIMLSSVFAVDQTKSEERYEDLNSSQFNDINFSVPDLALSSSISSKICACLELFGKFWWRDGDDSVRKRDK